MAVAGAKPVDEYIGRHPENVQAALQRVRRAIRKAVPDADEAINEVKKGTIRFPLSKQVPVRLIERIARFLSGEAAERARAKGSRPRRSRKPRRRPTTR